MRATPLGLRCASGLPRITVACELAARKGSKTAAVLELLRRPDGATLAEIMKATGWQAHTVPGFISGTLGKRTDLPVASVKNESGERTYRIEK